ncbi:MAG: hypothetical protein ACLQVX_08535 [Limisphaerales bacterium]
MNIVHRLLIAVPLIVWTPALAADPLARWHWRNPLPTANFILNVLYANGQFIAVDEGGEILTSSNGFDWKVRDCGYTCGLNGVAFGNGTYIAVGDADGYTALALTPPDGVTWTPQSIDAPPDTALQSVCFGNGLFVAGTSGSDQSPGIFTSPDGVNWAAQVPAGVVGGLGTGENISCGAIHRRRASLPPPCQSSQTGTERDALNKAPEPPGCTRRNGLDLGGRAEAACLCDRTKCVLDWSCPW